MGITLIITGIWSIIWSFVLNTRNFRSKVVFNIIPFFIGFIQIAFGCKLLGWL